jgi:hypothetical protein
MHGFDWRVKMCCEATSEVGGVGKGCACADPYRGVDRCGSCREIYLKREGHVCTGSFTFNLFEPEPSPMGSFPLHPLNNRSSPLNAASGEEPKAATEE